MIENLKDDVDKQNELWIKKSIALHDEKQKVEIEDAKLKAAEQLAASKR